MKDLAAWIHQVLQCLDVAHGELWSNRPLESFVILRILSRENVFEVRALIDGCEDIIEVGL